MQIHVYGDFQSKAHILCELFIIVLIIKSGSEVRRWTYNIDNCSTIAESSSRTLREVNSIWQVIDFCKCRKGIVVATVRQ